MEATDPGLGPLTRTPERDWYLRPMTERTPSVDAPSVEQEAVAEVLPGLYRAVLDAVADLELRGLRGDAASIRADATRAYSGAWNHGARDGCASCAPAPRGSSRPAGPAAANPSARPSAGP